MCMYRYRSSRKSMGRKNSGTWREGSFVRSSRERVLLSSHFPPPPSPPPSPNLLVHSYSSPENELKKSNMNSSNFFQRRITSHRTTSHHTHCFQPHRLASTIVSVSFRNHFSRQSTLFVATADSAGWMDMDVLHHRERGNTNMRSQKQK